MSEVVAQVGVHADAPCSTRSSSGHPGWFPAIRWRLLAPARVIQRGLVTVEFIFGIILVIAIITVVVSVIHNPAVGRLILDVVSWLLGLIKGVKG